MPLMPQSFLINAQVSEITCKHQMFCGRKDIPSALRPALLKGTPQHGDSKDHGVPGRVPHIHSPKMSIEWEENDDKPM